MSKYGDQTHCENLDCVSRLEIDQTGYLLNHPRSLRPGRLDSICPVSVQSRTTIGPPSNAIWIAFRWRADSDLIVDAYWEFLNNFFSIKHQYNVHSHLNSIHNVNKVTFQKSETCQYTDVNKKRLVTSYQSIVSPEKTEVL